MPGNLDPALPLVAPRRLASIDALRGFDMIWIVGAEDLVHGLKSASNSPTSKVLVEQFTHKAWEGFAFYDLIFPLFVFLAGVSITFSLDRILAERGVAATVVRMVRRAAVIYLLGLLVYGGISKGIDQVRWVGVLQRIAISYLAASLIYLMCGRRWQPLMLVLALILVGYWGLLCFVPPPGAEFVSFAEGQNIANYVDEHYLPGYKWDGRWDPEGLLSSIPAVGTCLLGVLAGLLLTQPGLSPTNRVARFLIFGGAMVLAGYAWGLQFPVIKKLWTSSYVLVAGGYSFLLVGMFYWIMDVLNFRRWAAPLLWVGTNALAIYMLANIIEMPKLAERVAGGEIKAACGAWGELMIATVALLLVLAVARFLYRRQLFLRA